MTFTKKFSGDEAPWGKSVEIPTPTILHSKGNVVFEPSCWDVSVVSIGKKCESVNFKNAQPIGGVDIVMRGIYLIQQKWPEEFANDRLMAGWAIRREFEPPYNEDLHDVMFWHINNEAEAERLEGLWWKRRRAETKDTAPEGES